MLFAALDQVQAQLALGKTIDVAAMLRIDDAIAEARKAAGQAEQHVTVKIVGPALTQCPKCDHQFDPESPHATQAKKLPRVIDGEVTARPVADPAPAPAAH
jgi:hypothetical protein